MGSNFCASCSGRGMYGRSGGASAIWCCLSKAANSASSQSGLRISMAYLRPGGNLFKNGINRSVKAWRSAKTGAELRELEQGWSQLGAKDIHGGEKFFQLGVAVREDFVVGDGARGLDGKNKIVGGFGGPVFYGSRGRASVES